jgi:Asp-tRNA(Asn)/Glu-tRNA(Gln) amidotransferase A subunit family amidase
MTDGKLAELTAIEAAEHIAAGDISAEEMTGACLDRIAALDGQVHAFIHIDPADALAQAKALDERRRNGNAVGPLHGVPVAIKDIFDTADYKTECGSPLLKGRQPMRDAAAVARLREAGAVIIGKTVSTEFAYFHPGATRNPHDLSRTPGGSSSGSAAAVAAGMVPLAIGSQTNGSMIRPASFCGVFGVKPSHGLISRAGALTLSRTLDHVGAYARSIEDVALILDALVGQDSADADTKAYAAPGFAAAVAEPSPLQPSFAFVRTPMWDKADAETRTALEEFAKEVGAREVELPPDYTGAWDALRAIMAVDMAHNLGPHLDTGGEASQQFRDLVAEGRSISAAQYLAAQRDARRYAEGMMGIFEQVADAIITLSARGPAPQGLGATGDPVFCSLWTLVGFPALNVPLLESAEGLPIGVQLVGAPGRDERLLRTTRTLIASLGEAD